VRGTVIWDLDGVLADCAWRLPLIQTDEPNWKRYHELADRDPLIPQWAALYRLLDATANVRNVVSTARPQHNHDLTARWLSRHALRCEHLITRNEWRTSVDHKKQVALFLLAQGPVVLAIDDYPGVCEMYRELGLHVIEVPSGYYNKGYVVDPTVTA
jgi:hypothetical protein